MDAELKAKWVKALRSGRYEQGNGTLKDDHGQYCCLGVLANLQGCDWKDVSNGYGLPEIEPFFDEKRASYEDGTGVLLPRFAGGIPKRTQKTLARMNDGEGQWSGKAQTFKQIADYIEREL